MKLPQIVPSEDWLAAHQKLLAKEKEATRARDALAVERRRQPMVLIDKDYVFEGPTGKARLLDMFDGRCQLCCSTSCSPLTSTAGRQPDAPGLTTDQGETFGLSVFLRDADKICPTYFMTSRGVEALGPTWTFLDLTPLGRKENWEDSPAGYPQTPPYEWWRRHDEYKATVT
ncbi:MAG: DUF899 domain-containing protein [Chloroflexi bacterium]|nr:MAG: DUF899 domain-containing protein [Chloroflexota bacterium]